MTMLINVRINIEVLLLAISVLLSSCCCFTLFALKCMVVLGRIFWFGIFGWLLFIYTLIQISCLFFSSFKNSPEQFYLMHSAIITCLKPQDDLSLIKKIIICTIIDTLVIFIQLILISSIYHIVMIIIVEVFFCNRACCYL